MKSSAFYFVVYTLFIVGLFTSAYFLYSLPVLFEESSSAVTPGVIDELSPVFLKLNISVGATLLLSIYCMFILIQRNKNVVEKIVYREKNEEKSADEMQTQQGEKEIAANFKDIEEAVKQKRALNNKCEALIHSLCQKTEASQGIFYQTIKSGSKRQIQMIATYAFSLPDSKSLMFEFGEGLAGQAAKEGKSMKIDDVPEGYINIVSGLGSASPSHLLIKPIVINGEVEAVVELASFKAFTTGDEGLIEKSISLIENEFDREKKKITEEKPPKEDGTSKKEK